MYKGITSTGEQVAIKRAQKDTMQGASQFKNEIELLSRVHHRNVVGLVGFCCEQGAQMLVYEFMAKGNLRDNLLGDNAYKHTQMATLHTSVHCRSIRTYVCTHMHTYCTSIHMNVLIYVHMHAYVHTSIHMNGTYLIIHTNAPAYITTYIIQFIHIYTSKGTNVHTSIY